MYARSRIRFNLNLALPLCLILALAVRLWSIDFGLPYRYHVDEPTYVVSALQLGQGNFDISYPLGSPDLGQFAYLGLFGLLFLGYLLLGRVDSPAAFARQYQIDPTPFYVIARGFSVVANLITIVLIYHLVRRWRGQRTAAVACLVMSLSFLDVRHTHFAEPYHLIALLVVAAVYLILEYIRTERSRHLVLAGLAGGAAIGLRYSMMPVAITILIGVLLRWRASGQSPSALVSRLGVVAVSSMIGYVIGSPAIVLNSSNYFKALGWYVLQATNDTGFQGIEFTNLPSSLFYATIIEVGFGLPLALMVLLGVTLAVWRHGQEDLLLLSFPVLYAILLLSAPAASTAFARYLVPLLPFLALFAADGVVTLVHWLTRHRSLRTRTVVLSAAVFALVLIPAYRIALLDHLWSRTDTRTLAKTWIESNVPDGARIATQWYGPPLATPSDPEPNSSRIYDTVILDPFSADERWYRIDYYDQNGFDYVVLSSFIYHLVRANPQEDDLKRSFYAALDEHAELVAEFVPYDGDTEPPFLFEQMWGPITYLSEFERPGPTIKVYRVQ